MNVLRLVGFQDRRYQIGDGETLADQSLCDPEMRRDILGAAPLLDQCGERLVLVDLIHRQTCEVFGQRGFYRPCIVSCLHHETGNRIAPSGFRR